MAMDYIKGAIVHAIITEACRRNRGDDAVIEEAIRRLREGWATASRNWPVAGGGKFHVVLIAERPKQDVAGMIERADRKFDEEDEREIVAGMIERADRKFDEEDEREIERFNNTGGDWTNTGN